MKEMIDTWAIILIAVLIGIAVTIWAKKKYQKYKEKYFTDDPDTYGETGQIDVEAVDFTLEEKEVGRPSAHLEYENDSYDPHPTMKRTNSF